MGERCEKCGARLGHTSDDGTFMAWECGTSLDDDGTEAPFLNQSPACQSRQIESQSREIAALRGRMAVVNFHYGQVVGMISGGVFSTHPKLANFKAALESIGEHLSDTDALAVEHGFYLPEQGFGLEEIDGAGPAIRVVLDGRRAEDSP